MRRILRGIYLIVLVLLAIAAGTLRRELPTDRGSLAAQKYDAWSGVLRVWVYEGWQCGAGTLSGWLNACASTFERARNGVYVQFSYVDAAAIRNFRQSGINPPDAILFPPGLPDSADGLCALNIDCALRPGLDGCQYAVPVAMGVYAWAYDAAKPARTASYYPDGEYRSWSLGMLNLFANLNLTDVGEFCEADDAYSRFVRGKSDAFVATQREISRLNALTEGGKAPDWQVDIGRDEIYTDQLLMFAVVENEKNRGSERQELCVELLNHLISEKCQNLLASRGAFSTLKGVRLYGVGAMAQIEDAIDGARIRTPDAFGQTFRQRVEPILNEFTKGQLTADEAWTKIFN